MGVFFHQYIHFRLFKKIVSGKFIKLSCLVLFLFPHLLMGEVQTDSSSYIVISADTVVETQDTILPSNLVPNETAVVKEIDTNHSPRKATLYSTFVPGLGQVYNKKYWKVPIIYGGMAASIYFIFANNYNHNIFRQAYIDYYDTDPNTVSFKNIKGYSDIILEKPALASQYGDFLKGNKDYYRRNRDLSIIVTLGIYVLQIIDASVDANLYDFDVSDDLSFRLEPKIFNKFGDNHALGFNCSLYF